MKHVLTVLLATASLLAVTAAATMTSSGLAFAEAGAPSAPAR